MKQRYPYNTYRCGITIFPVHSAQHRICISTVMSPCHYRTRRTTRNTFPILRIWFAIRDVLEQVSSKGRLRIPVLHLVVENSRWNVWERLGSGKIRGWPTVKATRGLTRNRYWSVETRTHFPPRTPLSPCAPICLGPDNEYISEDQRAEHFVIRRWKISDQSGSFVNDLQFFFLITRASLTSRLWVVVHPWPRTLGVLI